MGKRVKVTGYLDIEDYEYDDGPLGPLTQEAHEEIMSSTDLSDLEDVEFTVDEDA